MDLKEIFKDIVTDVNDSNRRIKADRRERGDIPLNSSQRAGEYFGGWLAILLPQFIGFILGLALTKIIGLHGTAYLVIGGLLLLFCGALAIINLLSQSKA